VVLSVVAGPPPTSMTVLWLIFMALMGVTIVWIGYGITGVPLGFLIDPRNKMSLSRLQLILWTIVVLPAFLAAAVFNFGAGVEDPLNITVPPEVWGLLGISGSCTGRTGSQPCRRSYSSQAPARRQRKAGSGQRIRPLQGRAGGFQGASCGTCSANSRETRLEDLRLIRLLQLHPSNFF
jgi:hypothetical protein